MTVFDNENYKRIDQAREEWLRNVINSIPFKNEIETVLDVGCGAGYFSKVLFDLGYEVTGLDLRQDNIDICKKRYPGITFGTVNLDSDFRSVGEFHLVLLFGILYHLQSPLQSIQRLSKTIKRIAIVSTRVASGNDMACLLFKEKKGEEANNSARVVSVPTLSALVQMFSYVGLKYIYRPEEQPNHPQWKLPPNKNGIRHSLVVSREDISIKNWKLLKPSDFLEKW